MGKHIAFNGLRYVLYDALAYKASEYQQILLVQEIGFEHDGAIHKPYPNSQISPGFMDKLLHGALEILLHIF